MPASRSDVSTCWPFPVFWRLTSAQTTPNAPKAPAFRSVIGTPTLAGGGIRVPGQAHQAAHPLRDQVESGTIPVGTRQPESGNRAVDQRAVRRTQIGIPQPQTVQRSRTQVLDEHIRARGHAPQQIGARLSLQVDHDASFVSIDPQKRGRLPVDERRPESPDVVAVRLLDLHHVGAHIRKQHAAERPRHHLGAVQHPDAIERPLLRRSVGWVSHGSDSLNNS